MYSWLNADPAEEEEEVATWNNFAQLYLDLLKCVHVSECDREEKPVVYLDIVPSSPLKGLLDEQYPLPKRLQPQAPLEDIQEDNGDRNGDGDDQDNENENENAQQDVDEGILESFEGLELPPITLLTCFYIQTHKGS